MSLSVRNVRGKLMAKARFRRSSDLERGPISFALKKALQAKHGPSKGPKVFQGVMNRMACDALVPADVDRQKAAVMAELGKMSWDEICSAIKHLPEKTRVHIVKLAWKQTDQAVQKK